MCLYRCLQLEWDLAVSPASAEAWFFLGLLYLDTLGVSETRARGSSQAAFVGKHCFMSKLMVICVLVVLPQEHTVGICEQSLPHKHAVRDVLGDASAETHDRSFLLYLLESCSPNTPTEVV